jgi:hypothetical protein
LVEVFIALLATIILKYEVAFPQDAVGYVLVVALLFPPALAIWFETRTVLDELGHYKHLRRVASMPKRKLKQMSSRLRERASTADRESRFSSRESRATFASRAGNDNELQAASAATSSTADAATVTCPRAAPALGGGDGDVAPRRGSAVSWGKLERNLSAAVLAEHGGVASALEPRFTLAARRAMNATYAERRSAGASSEADRPSFARQSSAHEMRRASMAAATQTRQTRVAGPGKIGLRQGMESCVSSADVRAPTMASTSSEDASAAVMTQPPPAPGNGVGESTEQGGAPPAGGATPVGDGSDGAAPADIWQRTASPSSSVAPAFSEVAPRRLSALGQAARMRRLSQQPPRLPPPDMSSYGAGARTAVGDPGGGGPQSGSLEAHATQQGGAFHV